MNTENPLVPDLLRRFVRTPHISSFCIGGTWVRLETNDLTLTSTIQSMTAGCETENRGEVSHWKLIRDEQAPCGGREVTVLSSEPIGTLLLGFGTVIAVDRERREILGFIAPDVTGRVFMAIVLPLILRFLRTPGTRDPNEYRSGPRDSAPKRCL